MDLRQMRPAARTLELADGQTIGLTLNFQRLYQLRAGNEPVYRRLFRVLNRDAKRGDSGDLLFDSVDVLYAAHCCYCIGTEEEPLDYEEFLTALPENIAAVLELAGEMIRPKKQTASAAPAGTGAGAAAGGA